LEKANFTVVRMARLLQVSKSGFYAWRARRAVGPTETHQRRAALDAQVRAEHAASDETYGAPRLAHELARKGTKVDKKTVARSMSRQGLEGISPRTFTPATTIAGESAHRIPDRVERTWDQGGLNKVWISDITYLRTGEGWLYLAAVTDAYSRRVLGWAMDSHMETGLVTKALRMAYTLRGDLPEGLVFHADRGTQYTSDEMWQTCQELGIDQSMGRTGVCWDNAMAESLWGTLKCEFYDRRSFLTRAEAKRAVATWIEARYNRVRLHSSIGYVPPVEFEYNLLTIADQAEAA
jgi:transposase InsO family protein